MRFSRGIISIFLGAAATAVTARTSSDLPLSMAHRLVIRSMERHSSSSSSSSPTQSARRDLSHADEAMSAPACTICFDGSDPYHPNRHLMVNPAYDTSSTAGKTSGQEETDDGGTNNSPLLQQDQQQQLPLTCSEYNNVFLSKLFPEESSCRAFQVIDIFSMICNMIDIIRSFSNMYTLHKHPYAIVQSNFHREVQQISAGAPARHHSARSVNLASRLLDPTMRFQLAWLATPAR